MTDQGRVLFIQAIDQIQALREQQPDALEGTRVVGLAPYLSLGLAVQRAGALFFPYTDFLSAADFHRLAQDACRLSRTWFADAVGLDADEDLIESVRVELFQWFSEILLAQRVVAEALRKMQPDRLLLAPGLDAKVEAVLRYEANEQGVPVEAMSLQLPVRAAPTPRGISYRLRQMLDNTRVRPRRDARPLVLGFGGDVDLVHLRRLMPALETDGRMQPFLVSTGEASRRAFNRPGGAEFPFQHLLPLRALLRPQRYALPAREWQEAFRERQKNLSRPYGFLFANPWLDPFFDRIFGVLLPRAMAMQRDLGALLDRLHPRLLLTHNEVSYPVRLLVLEARRRGISTLGLIHSGLNNMLYRDFESEKIAVWGQVHAHDFERLLGKKPEQLFPIGNPQYDTFGAMGCHSEPEHGEGEESRLSDRGDSSLASLAQNDSARVPCPRVLVVSAVSNWHMYHFDLRQHEATWRELERLPELGIQLLIKPHPRFDDTEFYRSLDHRLADWREARPGIALVQDVYLEEVLPVCDLAVVPSFPTTGALEAMLCRKPVVYLLCGNEEVPFCTSIAPGCGVVRDVQEIRPTITQLLSSPELLSELVQQGQVYLDEFLGPRDGAATDRLVELAARIVEGTL